MPRKQLPPWFPSDIAAIDEQSRETPTIAPRSPTAGLERNAVQTRTIFPPWLYPLKAGNDFFINRVIVSTAPTVLGKSVVLPAGVGASVQSQPFIMPTSMRGVVRVVSIFVNAPTLVPPIDVDWTLRINGGPVQGWTFTTYPRAATNLSSDFGGVVRLPQDAVVDVNIINNNANGPWVVGTQFGGWYYSVEEAKRLYGELYDLY
ncbi:MAG: hypothetical protein GY906_22850 [bacterium]|nr:hypothetical protein [bacterium]